VDNSKTTFNPFPGLRPFESDERRFFFGREGQSDELLRRLRITRFLAMVGTSGSGKSSLMRASLIPALHGGFMVDVSAHWHIAIMRPGGDPIGNLAVALNERGLFRVSAEMARYQTAMLRAALSRISLGLIETVKHAALPVGQNLLVVVDQFEELFRFKSNAMLGHQGHEAAHFVQLLLEAVRQTELPIYVLLTMRSDYFGHCAQFRDLPEAINEGQYLIPRLTREQRRQAIAGPVAVAGGQITQRLVNRLLNDMGDNPDQLPILQHALMRTWDYWQAHRQNGEPLDLHHYEAIGGMATALSQHADETFAELFDERSRQIAEKIFKRLTEKGSDNPEARIPSKLKEIRAVVKADLEEVKTVIEPFRRFGRSFLMPPTKEKLDDESLIDISHESLIRNWRRLNNWVEEEALSAQIYRRLAETAVLYLDGKADLLRNPELQLALNWRAQNQPNIDWAQRYHPDFDLAISFLEESKKNRDAQAKAKRRQRIKKMMGWGGAMILTTLLVAAAFVIYFNKKASDAQIELERNKNLVLQQKAELGKKLTAADSVHNLGYDQMVKMNYNEALESFKKAYAIFEGLKEEQKQIQTLINIGRVYGFKNDSIGAKQFYDYALEISRQVGDKRSEGKALESIAALMEQKGNLKGALKFYSMSDSTYREAGDQGSSGRITERLAVYWDDIREVDKAIQNYRSAYKSYEVANDQLGIASVKKAIDRITAMHASWGFLVDLHTSTIHDLTGEEIGVGRNTEYEKLNRIDYPNSLISRRHIVIRRDQVVEDLRSRNGTSINARLLPYGVNAKLSDGDLIVLANIKTLHFRIERPHSFLNIPLKTWAIFIDNQSRSYHYLVDLEYSLVQENGTLALRVGFTELALMKLRWLQDKAKMFEMEDGWKTIFTLKETDYDYKTYILKSNEWVEALDLPLSYVKLSPDGERIVEEGPAFQIVLFHERTP